MTTMQSERRLTSRVLDVWKKIAGQGFPKRSQLDPMDFGADWANCLMIDIDDVMSRSRFSYVGGALRDPRWPTFDRQCISECLEGTLLELVTRHIPRVLETKKSTSFGGSAIHDDSDILYRTILLPLSETGQEVDGILAAVGYREITVSHEIPFPDMQPESHRDAKALSR